MSGDNDSLEHECQTSDEDSFAHMQFWFSFICHKRNTERDNITKSKL